MGKTTRPTPSVGRAEMEILHYVTDHHPISIREVAAHFAKSKGLARTTILNVMERLRKKGYLVRDESGGIYQYSPKQAKRDLLKRLVGEFVERFLEGSVSPFVAYLADKSELDKAELAELRRIVREMKGRK
jgi:predicted transcriptional regulator